jgi:hypothetical protein
MASYNQTVEKFNTELDNFLTNINNKINATTIKTETSTDVNWNVVLEDNHIYINNRKKGITDLKLIYPEGDFICSVIFKTATRGALNITLPEDTLLVGRSDLNFYNNEAWELNIHNKRVVAVQLFEV